MDMDTPDSAQPASSPAPEAVTPSRSPAPAPRRTLAAAGLVVGTAALVAAGLAWWQAAREGSASNNMATELALARTDIDGLRRAIDLDRRERELLRQRLGDAETINKSLREEVLGVSERARVLEDAIANLADKRLSGHDALLLNEAEMVLLLAQQRYELFHDAAAAARAYRIADEALAALQDPLYATARETLAVELRSLEQLNQPAAGAALAELAALRAQVAELPLAAALAGSRTDPDSRLWRALGQFVRISRSGADGAVNDPTLLRSFVGLELRAAELALLERNEAALRAALARARKQLQDGFAAADPAVVAALATLARVEAQNPAPPAEPVLGATLKELRNLRAAQGLQSAPRPAVGAQQS